jgi:S-formylglutathione hydrolase FrmB
MKKQLATLPLSPARVRDVAILHIFMAFALFAQAPQGKVLESVVLKSNILKKDLKLNVYLPPNYATAQNRFPVVYLLHGMMQNYADWVGKGDASRTADSLITKGAMPEMIIVMPDAGNTFFVNSADGYNYEDYFFKELIPYIDSTYKTRASRDYRSIAGLSMGGYGAILYSLKYSDVFSVCAAFSGAIVTDEEITNIPDDMWDNYYANLFGKAKGKDRLQLDIWRKNNTLELIQQGKNKDLKKTKWYFDIGDDDSLYRGNSALHVLMSNKGIPHEFRMRDGNHNWDYWRTGLGDALKFVAQELKP